MNIGGMVLLMLVIVGGVFGLIFVAAHVTTTAPVDTYGTTTSVSDNLTRDTVTGGTSGTGLASVGASTGVWLVIIMAVGVLATAMVFLVRAKMGGGGNFRSRY